MRSVRCPECDAETAVPVFHDEAYIHCRSCAARIPLVSEEEAAPGKVRKKKKKRGAGAAYLALWPLVLTVPLTSCICLAAIHRMFAGLGVCSGILAFFTGLIMAYLVAKREGLTTGENMPPIVIQMPAMQIFFIVNWAIQKPLKVGPWSAVAFIGLGTMFGSAIVSASMNTLWPRAAEGPAPQKEASLDRSINELEDKDIFTRGHAAARLANHKPNERRAEVVQKLMPMTRHESHFVRHSALKGLETWATPNEIPELIPLLAHPDAQTRLGAIAVLGGLDDPRTHQPLIGALREFTTRNDAKKALLRVGPPVEKDLLPLLHDKDAGIRRSVLEILTEIGTQESVPALQMIADGQDADLRGAAAQAMKSITARSQK